MFIAMAVSYLPSPVRGDISHAAPDGAWKKKRTLTAINISSLRDLNTASKQLRAGFPS
jgi:hypothetical protein